MPHPDADAEFVDAGRDAVRDEERGYCEDVVEFDRLLYEQQCV